ncbi:MAG: HAD-IIB family hydrolase [Nitrospirota bacterium]
MKKFIIFTDLDGTLLDSSTYSFEKALPAIELIKEKDIPLIICSSKTRKEIEHYRKKFDNYHPFISENGGGIFIPKDYFPFRVQSSEFRDEEDKYTVIRLGATYSDLRRAIEELRKEGFKVKGFGDMSVQEIREITNLNIKEAEMSKERNFDEPFIFDGDEIKMQELFNAIRKKGFNYVQGRLFHIIGNNDKGKALSILIDLYKRKFGEILTIAIGDGPNDLPMFERVDYPIVVQRHDGKYEPQINIPDIIKAEGIGPEGWNKAINLCLKKFLT